MITKSSLLQDLKQIGIAEGDLLLVHSSYKAIGTAELTPLQIIECLHQSVGTSGTLLMPALSYKQKPKHLHNNRTTPSNVGIIPELFRAEYGALRSVHPTHSVCAVGAQASELLANHRLDRTPCGVHSPFRKLLFRDAKIVMLGCGLRPNTTMHGIEEIIGTPYLFGDESKFVITDSEGQIYERLYRDHGFDGWIQRYDRIADYLEHGKGIWSGKIGNADSYLINSRELFTAGIKALTTNRFAFVDPI